jgi:hypothetical protein
LDYWTFTGQILGSTSPGNAGSVYQAFDAKSALENLGLLKELNPEAVLDGVQEAW